MKKNCLITFDIEEWFQVENLKSVFHQADWRKKSSTVEKNTDLILDILKKYGISATFFILGWVAERNPNLVLKIQKAGHEIASHGYAHELANIQGEDEVINDLLRSKKILEDIIAVKISGYRAPNFSISDQILGHLKEIGFVYDSSYNPFRLNPRYGNLNSLGEKIAAGCYKTTHGVFEIPLSSYYVAGFPFPMAGGAYFRIIPFWIFKQLVNRKIQQEPVYNFYLHPWEFEPGQEKIKALKWQYRLRHYYGLKNTADKFEKLILFLKNNGCQFLTIKSYIGHID